MSARLSSMSGRILSTVHRPDNPQEEACQASPKVLLAVPCCAGEPPPRRRRKTSAREQKRNKPRPTGPHWTNQTHHYRAQNATARAQLHGSELWSPVRDEEAAGSNPVTPTSVTGR